MQKNDIAKTMRRFIVRTVVLIAAVVILINISYLMMAWLVRDVLDIQGIYLSSEFQFLGTFSISMVVITILIVFSYRLRKKELLTLSENIDKVANGDFSGKITYNHRDPMGHVYDNFNKMRDELADVQVLRRDFISSFSHEFKTPLASINGFSSLMLEKELPREEQELYLSIIKDESDRLIRITENTILMTKLTSSKILSSTEEFNLGEQLRQCAILLSNEWIRKDISFEAEFPRVMVQGNRELFQHIWLNLIGNAIKYTPNGGEISVDLSADQGWAVIQVSDTGEGMDENTMKHLFDPYYQGDSSHSRQGLGLGLAIVKQITDHCGGTVQVESRLEEGSTFTVRIPLQSKN